MQFGKHDWRALTILLGIVAAAVVLTWWQIDRERARSVSCTAEAMICPDGTAVGRTAPSCEFAPCPQQEASGAETTVSGTVICLPHKDTTGPQTLECAFGIETAEGNYSLKDTSPDYRFIMGLPTGEQVTIRGSLRLEPSDRYQSKGILEILEIVR